ncbi:hypothetical protein ACFPOG_12950 [Paenibacillus aestuarii]|uniref:Uncharacterized protein n=1 Tax=Paenibacillus aestuarii TaxID=516965 RepID=A0ABW0K774_9BACL
MKEHIITVDGHNIVVDVSERRYPGLVLKWAFWKFQSLPNSSYRTLGDPYPGKGAMTQIRSDVIKQASEAIQNGYPSEQNTRFNCQSMRWLILQDPFLKKSYARTREGVMSDIKAMELVFNTYVIGDSAKEKTYAEFDINMIMAQ